MSARITVIVPEFSQISHLQTLIASLDAQTVAYHDVDVVVLTTATTPEERLADLERLRPNVTVRAVEDAGNAGDRLEETLSTPWVLRLPADEPQRLPPRALELLLSAAERHGVGWVAGRRYTVGDDLQVACYLHDRLVEKPTDETAFSALLHTRAQPVAGPGVLLGSYPCLSVGPAAVNLSTPTGTGPRQLDTTAHWAGPSLQVTVTGSCGDHHELGISVTQPASGLDFWVPAAAVVDGAGGFRVTAELTPSVAAAGEPLGTGSWQLWLTSVDGAGRGHRARLAGRQPGGAVIGGRLVGCSPTPGPLVLDLDAVKLPVFGYLDPAQASVVESAAGSLLTLGVAGLHVHGDAEAVPGALLQDRFALPARLVADPATPRIECRVSGLPGIRPVSLRFGGIKPQPTGLALEIDPTGEMRVVPQPTWPEPTARPASSAEPRADRPPHDRPRTDRPQARISRLRRRVPRFAEPAVRWLSRNPTARRLYRRLLSAG